MNLLAYLLDRLKVVHGQWEVLSLPQLVHDSAMVQIRRQDG